MGLDRVELPTSHLSGVRHNEKFSFHKTDSMERPIWQQLIVLNKDLVRCLTRDFGVHIDPYLFGLDTY